MSQQIFLRHKLDRSVQMEAELRRDGLRPNVGRQKKHRYNAKRPQRAAVSLFSLCSACKIRRVAVQNTFAIWCNFLQIKQRARG